ncbi:MAG: ExeM/NucH family extracellular endonuclease [Gemmatimonadetes bacterium]|nr:ExeM/NucH family extracellular endonuclease [Gemmatimonadota bacterium]
MPTILDPRYVRGLLLAAVAALGAAACSGRDIAGPKGVQHAGGTPSAALAALTCTGSVSNATIHCSAAASGANRTIFGGQNSNVRLTSSNASYTAADSIFQFDVTVQNLLPEKIGTADGVNLAPEGIRVFFSSGPAVTSGTGSAYVANADDVATFTAPAQPFFQYDTILGTNQASAPRQWKMHVDPSVGTFSFVVYVSTPLEPLIVITELMANPGGTVQDSSGEYVEIYNAGRFPVNLVGMILNDGSGAGIGAVDTVPADFIVPAGAYRVLGRTQDPAKNGGITVDYLYTHKVGGTATGLQFSNSAADYFRIRAASGATIDSVRYSNASIAAAAGVARELTDPALENSTVDGANWASATTNYQAANKGTPGALNSTSTVL